MQNLAERCCWVCGERYDTPHKSDCSQRRNPATPSGKPRVLVKMEDLEPDEETSTRAAQSFDLMIELEEEDTQGEVSADCGCKLERTEFTVGFIFCDLHRHAQRLLRDAIYYAESTYNGAEGDDEPPFVAKARSYRVE
jgi:hypothetical protein